MDSRRKGAVAMAGHEQLTIGDLAARTGCRPETVRYYERAGIMPEPARSPGGHRIYTHADLKRLHFVRRCRDLGIGLAGTRELLTLIDSGEGTCDELLASRDKTTIETDSLDEAERRIRSWQGLCRVLIASNECVYLD